MFAYRPLVHDAPERVIEVRADPADVRPGALIVVTQQGSRRTTYRGVIGFRGHVGDELSDTLRHRARTVSIAWSPWDGVADD